MATTNHHFYEQSPSSWMNEWADNDEQAEPMTDAEQEEAKNAACIEMDGDAPF